MANLYIFYDGRFTRKDGSGTLKLALRHQHKTVYESLDIHIQKHEWDAERCQVIYRPDKKFLNVMLRKRLADATEALQRVETRSDFARMDAHTIILMLKRGSDTSADTWQNSDYLIPVFNEYVALAKKASTAESYRSTLSSLKAFEPSIDSFQFKDVNVAWLRRYHAWLLEEKKMSTNGANVYLRNLRTIFNYALKNDYTSARYPFRDIDMTTVEPDKRTIPYEKFLDWCTAKADSRMVIYRDLFMLSFYLCGIRPVDLIHAKKDSVQEGRLVYYPQKLNGRTKLSIKIEPEAWELIHKYEGQGEYLLNILDTRADYKQFCKQWNMGLKTIGRAEITKKRSGTIPYITIYYSRICWATYAYNVIDTPMDVVSQGLGHKSGLRVTNFYVKRDGTKVDEANRKLIDRVKADIAARMEKG
jgi:integrase